MGMRTALTMTMVLASVLAGCSGESDPPPRADVSKVAWPDGFWPFTVDEGVLTCYDAGIVTFSADGTEYALNEAATSSGRFRDISPILRMGYVEIRNTRQPVEPSLDPMTDRGLDLCR